MKGQALHRFRWRARPEIGVGRGSGFVVTSPFERELITEAESLDDEFEMARDAIK
jgi:hypothetical protein